MVFRRNATHFILPYAIAIVAVSVEALVFIVIGRSCSEGCGFDSHCRSASFLRFNSRPIMYGAVGSLVLSWSWTVNLGLFPSRASGLNCVITLGKGYVRTICLS